MHHGPAGWQYQAEARHIWPPTTGVVDSDSFAQSPDLLEHAWQHHVASWKYQAEWNSADPAAAGQDVGQFIHVDMSAHAAALFDQWHPQNQSEANWIDPAVGTGGQDIVHFIDADQSAEAADLQLKQWQAPFTTGDFAPTPEVDDQIARFIESDQTAEQWQHYIGRWHAPDSVLHPDSEIDLKQPSFIHDESFGAHWLHFLAGWQYQDLALHPQAQVDLGNASFIHDESAREHWLDLLGRWQYQDVFFHGEYVAAITDDEIPRFVAIEDCPFIAHWIEGAWQYEPLSRHISDEPTPTFAKVGPVFTYTAANWHPDTVFYFECFLKANSGTVHARLVNNSSGAVAAGSQMGTSYPGPFVIDPFVRIRNGPVTFVDGQNYRTSLAGDGAILSSRIIAI